MSTELQEAERSGASTLARQVLTQDAEACEAARHEQAEVEVELTETHQELPLGEVVKRGGGTVLGTLFALNLVDEFDRAAFGVLGPDIQRSLGMSDATLAFTGVLGGFVVVLAAIPIGYLGDRMSRTRLIGTLSLAWAGFALLTGMVQSAFQLGMARVLTGVGKSNEGPLHKPVLADQYPLAGRSRVFAVHSAASPAGNVLAPILAGTAATMAGGVAGKAAERRFRSRRRVPLPHRRDRWGRFECTCYVPIGPFRQARF